MSKDLNPTYQPKQDQAATKRANDYEAQEQRLREKVAAISHQILVLSGKGGVGKSTVAASLAWGLAARDLRTGLLDADLNGPSIPLMMGVDKGLGQGLASSSPVRVLEQLHVMSIGFLLEDRNTPTIWRGPLRSGVVRQFIADIDWGELDYLVVDLPPGTGDEPLTVAQACPQADGGLIVTTPQEASLADCRKAINFLRAVDLPVLGVIENMSGFVCPYCGEVSDVFGAGGGESMAQEMGVPFLGRLPLAPEVVTLCDHGHSVLGAGAPAAVRDAFASIVEALVSASADDNTMP